MGLKVVQGTLSLSGVSQSTGFQVSIGKLSLDLENFVKMRPKRFELSPAQTCTKTLEQQRRFASSSPSAKLTMSPRQCSWTPELSQLRRYRVGWSLPVAVIPWRTTSVVDYEAFRLEMFLSFNLVTV